MKKIALAIIAFLLPYASYAEDGVMGRFTRSISNLYGTSQSCKRVIETGPQEYIKLIGDYFNGLYPDGAGYWALPTANPPISDRSACITLLQKHVGEYQRARKDFEQNYPAQAAPPVLIAYTWDKRAVPQAPLPQTSYQPPYFKKQDSKSFKGTQ